MKKLLSIAAWKRLARRAMRSCGIVPPAPRAEAPFPNAELLRAEDIALLNPDDRRRVALTIAAGVEFIVPTRNLDAILPGASTAEVRMLPRLIRNHPWAMPEHELLTLGAITRMIGPRHVVELGTFQGGSTLVMAANMADGGRIVTVDLDPSQRERHEHGLGTGLQEFDLGGLFRGTRYESMIEQRFSNTLDLHAEDLVGQADLVFIDADHSYAFVTRDTAKAMTFVRPGGWVLWHDYTWTAEDSACAGVTRAVDEFFRRRGGCFQIAGTRFAIHRVPPAPAEGPERNAECDRVASR